MGANRHPDDPPAPFDVELLDYEVPEELVAQTPADRRDAARLLVLNRTGSDQRDLHVRDLPNLLRPGDLLVLNDTRVLPARCLLRRATGGRLEGLFLDEPEPGVWRMMLKGSRKVRPRETLAFEPPHDAQPLLLTLTTNLGGGEWLGRVSEDEPALALLERVGQTALPPYIRRDAPTPEREAEDRTRYQTVFARTPGAVAAPTAGLHLTPELLDRLRQLGVETTYVTLHVGIGTFQPLRVQRLADHDMHVERYELPAEAAEAVAACRGRGGRVVAVGTTSVRVLESAATDDPLRPVAASAGTTQLFIYPPYRFRAVDGLLTNFHWPRSTLIALVMALAGVERIQSAYRHAIAERYRLFSFGDAMLIL